MPSTRSHDARRTGGGRRIHAQKRDPGAYIGRLPERATETIPGGVGPQDERVAAVGTQPGPVRGMTPASERGAAPEGHREAGVDGNDTKREAGQNR